MTANIRQKRNIGKNAPAGEEGAKDLLTLEGIDLTDVSQDGFVDVAVSVGVVGVYSVFFIVFSTLAH